MADFTSNAYANVYVNNEQARSRLSELTSQAESLRKKLDEARLSGDVKGAISVQKQLNKVEKEAQNVVKAYFDVDKVMKNLSQSGVRDLRQALRTLEKELNSGKIARGSNQWDAHVQKIRAVKNELQSINKSTSIIPTKWQQFTSSFNSNFTAMASSLLAFSTIKNTVTKSITDFAHLDDVYSDVMKTTGMTREAVVEMNEAFKKTDTRTSREEMNKMAEELGRMGVVEKDITAATIAADKAAVALGDSFSGGAGEVANTLGLLNGLYAETKAMAIDQSFISIGSAMNTLAADGVSSEQNIAAFAKRIGSMPEALKPAIADALGLGAAFEESGIEAEIASRAYSIVLSRASEKTDAFAKVMGKSTEEVTAMINKNPVDFFLKFSESMRGMSAVDTAKTLKDLSINAEGANKIIGAASNNTERFREILELSNQSFKDGTSVINEFNIKNNNAQAQLEKAKKVFFDASVELGERLNPAMLKSTNLFTHIVKILPSVIDFVQKYALAIGIASAAILVYATRTKLATAATVLQGKAMAAGTGFITAYKAGVLLLTAAKLALTGNTAAATVAMRAFNIAVKSNPLGIFLTILTAVVGAVVLFSNNTSKAEESLKEFNAELLKEQRDLNNIFEAYKRTNEGTAEKDRLLKIIKEKYGPYIQNLIDEQGRITDIEAAQRLANKALQESIALKFRDKALNDINTDNFKKQADEIAKIREKLAGKYGDDTAAQAAISIGEIISDQSKSVQQMRSEIDASLKTLFGDETYKITGKTLFSDDVFTDLNDLMKIVSTVKFETADINRLYEPLVGDLIKQQDAAQQELLSLQKQFNEMSQKDLEQYIKVTSQYGAKAAVEAKKIYAARFPKAKLPTPGGSGDDTDNTPDSPTGGDKPDKYKKQLDALEDYIGRQKTLIIQDRANNLLTQEEYNKQLEYIEQERLGKLVEIYGLEEEKGRDAQDKIFQYQSKMQGELAKQVKISADELGKIDEQTQADRFAKAQEGMNKLAERMKQQQEVQIAAEVALTEAQRAEMEKRIEITQFGIDSIQEIMGSLSYYIQEANAAEVAAVNRKYDDQIKAAGKNERKVKKLEEQRDKELKEINRKNADKAFKLQVAQALASTAQSAINAYMSTAAIPVIGPAAAPIAAAVATASGLLQVAAIKKQHDAAMQEFYTGGYTMPGARRQVAGIVHAGEFVGNADAVANPAVRQVFDVIDMAQRTNTISSLTPEDFTRSLDYRQAENRAFVSGIAGAMATGSPAGQSEISLQLLALLNRNAEVTDRLNNRLDEPFVTQNTVTGKHGIKEALDKYDQIKRNKNR